MAIPRTEQETVITFDVQEQKWHLYTSYPPHIRKYQELVENVTEHREENNLVAIEGHLLSDVYGALKKKRTLTEEQKERLAEQLNRTRSSNN